MADYLALDWDGKYLSGLEAQVGKGTVRIQRAFTLERPSEISPTNEPPGTPAFQAQAAGGNVQKDSGEWLRGELDRLKIGSKQVLICLPRESVVVRQLEVPNVPDHELPDLVRLQAETKMSSSLDRQILDFLPLPKTAGADTREVLLATMTKDSVAAIQRVMETAGLEATSIGLSSVAMTEVVARMESRRGFDPNQTCLVLARHQRRLEISLVRNRHLLFTHSAELSGQNEQQDVKQILAEVSRSFVALERHLNGEKLARAWVIGGRETNAALCSALTERISCEVMPLEPVSDLNIPFSPTDINGDEAHFAGPVGMLLAASGAETATVDFLHPRKAEKRLTRKAQQIRYVAIGAVAVIALAGVFVVMKNRSLASQLKEKQTEIGKLTKDNRGAKPIVDARNLVGEWNDRNLNWPEQFQQLNKALPGTDRIYLTNVQFIPSRKRGTDLARITAVGFAIERYDVEKLEQKLQDMGYTVITKPTRLDPKDAQYRHRFELDLKLTKSTLNQAKPKPKSKARK